MTGLASAAAVAARGLSTCVLERHPRPGLDTSTHNSGVIHAVIYYPGGPLKAKLCLEGRRLLYEFCASHHVPHARTGKIVVASDQSEVAALEALLARGTGNGVDRLAIVDSAFVRAREPHVHAVAALYSPDSGIVNADELVTTLFGSGMTLVWRFASHADPSAPKRAKAFDRTRNYSCRPGRECGGSIRTMCHRCSGPNDSRFTHAVVIR